MSSLRDAAQAALEALESSRVFVTSREKIKHPEGTEWYDERIAALRAALAQQAEPLNLRDPAVQKRLASQWGYVPAAAQAEPVEPVAWYQKRGQEVFTWPHPACWGQEDKPWTPLYTAPPPPQRKPLTEKEMYIVEEEARKNFRLAQAGPRGQMITYWDSLTPWLIRAVERAHGIKE